ncbi:predicted coding region AF_0297 [Archaeoglobus fulgidus DSM 4304]|jgi:hypothetical protein|uniref:Uncharacterized protein AF_0297 n=3 Tax=Archaeoglobus fulgidus TaxID=2234 RepID=Y297_ARCFU|nr:RecName: Full=Uncharacterized protein AF_0297 [Archaeoglobus fulgidus DSM 4304]AAB90940.1 predicted coding region AF_0297 [Archaeoglobus fulgidus DSM 4304]AIG97120.1 hypothetical protein AFULGI_00002940 [Archaeoglobus fulgidus DSM 8774]KUK05596.1 MAG: Uncharacterized protein XD48_2179 [Archaeoglobus fulgidus]
MDAPDPEKPIEVYLNEKKVAEIVIRKAETKVTKRHL